MIPGVCVAGGGVACVFVALSGVIVKILEIC